MPSYWSLRPKDFLDMRFEDGEDELTEEAVAQQVPINGGTLRSVSRYYNGALLQYYRGW